MEEAIAETGLALRMSPMDSFAGIYTAIHGLALLGARRFLAREPAFRPGQTLRVEATQVFIADNGLAAFDARILDQDRVLAEATLSAFQPEDVQAFLREVGA